jgi:hypothetical protein
MLTMAWLLEPQWSLRRRPDGLHGILRGVEHSNGRQSAEALRYG